MNVPYANPITDIVDGAGLPVDVADLIRGADGSLGVLDSIFYTDYSVSLLPNGIALSIGLVFAGEATISMPGVDGLALVIGAGVAGATKVRATVLVTDDDFEFRLEDVVIALRFPPSVLKPVAEGNAPPPPYAELSTTATLTLGKRLGIRLDIAQSLTLPECEIADSGVTVSAGAVSWNFERGETLPAAVAAGLQGEFLGVALENTVVKLPPDFANGPILSFDYCCIGTGGLTGGVALSFAQPPSCDIGGFSVELSRVAVRFQASRLIAGEVEAVLRGLPLFDADVDLTVQITAGGLKVAIASAGPGALLTLTKPGVIAMSLTAAELRVGQGGGALRLSGTITPLFQLPGGDQLPGFGVDALTITSTGQVSVEGGWISLPKALRAKIGPFALELSKFGLGTEPGGARWVSFSGGLSLSVGVAINASVDGLKIRWDDTGILGVSLSGVKLGLTIPNVLLLEGEVRFDDANGRFDGAGTLQLTSLGLTITVRVVVGRRATYNYFYIYLFVAPPIGIPLAQTGIAIYGFEGLYANNMAPDKAPNELWYRDWYRRPVIGAADQSKWADEQGAMAFGAGVLIGTFPDKGYSVAVKGLLIIVIPGPILMLEAKANLISSPSALAAPGASALFTMLFVLDGRAGTIELAIEPHYVYPEAGDLVDVTGIAEAFYSFNDPNRWYVYLGRREREKRIRATIISLFEANMYLMLEPHALEMGFFIGYVADWDLGPVHIGLQAFIEGGALISWRPKQLKASLHLQGGVALTVLGFGFDLSALAEVSARSPKPFEVDARVALHVNLPWPLPDFDAEVPLHWEEPAPPRLTAPLETAGVTHPLTTATWALDGAPGGAEPVVPLDARLALTFGSAVQDVVGVGDNAIAAPDLVIGDYTLRPSLSAIALDVEQTGTWAPYATTSGAPRRLYGAWQAQPGASAQGNRRLLLWSRTPYEWQRALTDAAIEQLEEAEALDPCEPLGLAVVVDFDDHANVDIDPYARLDHREMGWTPGRAGGAVIEVATAAGGRTIASGLPRAYYRGLALPDQFGLVAVGGGPTVSPPATPAAPVQTSALRIEFDLPAAGVTVLVLATGGWSLAAFDAAGAALGTAQTAAPLNTPFPNAEYRPLQLTIRGGRITRLELNCTFRAIVLAVASHAAPSAAERSARAQAVTQVLARFSSEEPVLEPHRRYRLRVTTTVEALGVSLANAEIESRIGVVPNVAGSTCTFAEEFVFRTEGPPGDVALTPTAADPDSAAPLDTLAVYVSDVLPPRGAPAVYRSYDLRVRFGADYVAQMYVANGQTLLIDLRADDGQTAPVACSLGHGSETVLRREERAWLDTLERSTCAVTSMSSTVITETVVAGVLPAAAPLAPHRRYDAVLRGDPLGSTEGARPLAAWSFVSSHFLDFADHFSLTGPVRTTSASASGAAWIAAAADALAAGDPWAASGTERTRRRVIEGDAFTALMAQIDIEPVLAPVVELTAVTSGGTTWAMLLSSPEPFDWDRLAVELKRRNKPIRNVLYRSAAEFAFGRASFTTPRLIAQPESFRVIRDADGTRALLFALRNGAAGPFPNGQYTISGTFHLDAGPDIPVLSRGGASASEMGTIAWTLPIA